jgi:hypothetical protein
MDAKILISGNRPRRNAMEKISRTIYWLACWLFVTGVVTQVFLAGMAVVAQRMGWDNHIGLGHLLGAPLLLMLISQYPAHLPRRMKGLTWLQFLVYFVQADVIIFLRQDLPVVSAFHPVLALVDFALGLSLARRAWPLLKQTWMPTVAGSQQEISPAD